MEKLWYRGTSVLLIVDGLVCFGGVEEFFEVKGWF